MDEEPSDAEVVLASVANPERFSAVFDRHHRRIWTYLARRGGADWADEHAGEVFVAAFVQRAGYDPTRGTVTAWLYGIATNQARGHLRRQARAGRALARVAGRGVDEPSGIEHAEAAVASSQQLALVRGAMADLPDADREVLVLYAWEGLTYDAIASALGVEVGTVRSRLSRARGRLRELTGPTGPGRKVHDG